MEKEEIGSSSKSHTGIRCAKAAMLLSSLETRLRNQEKETMKQIIDELKMEVVKERFKRRKMKVWNHLEFSIQIVLLFSLLTYFLLLAFDSC
ncbi:hypothetical protein SOVF_036670 [Spinacia oleracea]|nr:hypothetical protein SOVF_036670 [Spinacia oleracea]